MFSFAEASSGAYKHTSKSNVRELVTMSLARLATDATASFTWVVEVMYCKA